LKIIALLGMRSSPDFPVPRRHLGQTMVSSQNSPKLPSLSPRYADTLRPTTGLRSFRRRGSILNTQRDPYLWHSCYSCSTLSRINCRRDKLIPCRLTREGRTHPRRSRPPNCRRIQISGHVRVQANAPSLYRHGDGASDCTNIHFLPGTHNARTCRRSRVGGQLHCWPIYQRSGALTSRFVGAWLASHRA
jgi:hypothetical protein